MSATKGDHPAGSSTRRAAAIGALVAGAAGFGLGAVFGFRTFAKRDDAEAACPGRACASAAAQRVAVEANDDARAAAVASTVSFVAGAVGAGVGAYLLATGSSPAAGVRVAPLVTTHSASLDLAASW